ncbi:MAG TPA: NADH-quinone oxidoreductase subunit H [Candidatus Deferrimicrobium sp.]|nr:NADH-quinone oxidoreductase subunit H [Candidatus Deferrimicrobium sp.]
MGNVLMGLLQMILLLALAPLINGVIKKTKAYFQNRQGPGICQGYYDLLKLFSKDRVISEHSSWIFRVTPIIVFGSVTLTCLLVPTISLVTPLESAADLLVLVYLLGLARFFTTLAGLDAGSSFGGMGSSREITFAATIEPAMLLALFTVALAAGNTNIFGMVRNMLEPGTFTTAHILAFLALYTVAVADTGRVPVDNPDTHLELTMIHEGMILEYSGKELALINWASQVKQLLMITFLVNLFFPMGIATHLGLQGIMIGLSVYVLKILLVAITLGIVETTFAKMRLFKVPKLLAASFMLSLFALVTLYVVGGKL